MTLANDIITTLRAYAQIVVTGNLVTTCSQSHEVTLAQVLEATVNGQGEVQITEAVSSQAHFCGVCEEPNPTGVFNIDSEYAEAYQALTGDFEKELVW